MSKIDLGKMMQNRTGDSLNRLAQDVYLPTLAAAFLLDRKAQNMTEQTQRFYRVKLEYFINWLDTQAVKSVAELTPELLREFFIAMSERGHNAGGVHAVYRTVKAFLRWYALEFEPLEWRDPLKKVKPPKVDIEPLEPVAIETVRAMLDTCKRGKFTDERDRAILLFLLDTGVRAGELIALDRQDADIFTGDILIRKSKSRKPRTVFLGRQARRALRAYLKIRDDMARALFVNSYGERLKMAGLRQVMVRRANKAGVPIPPLHSFRRAFALAMNRAGVDLLTIARLLGHADLSILERYIKQTGDDLREAHERGSPVDGLP
ncbi:MAG: tyrosine-type recombinase/integrase [Anaerolineales bacterium]|nr:tyrosine-type recombinase/integrase [Anaerolineales bacterium]